MADYKVTDTELTSVANAIRTKGGTSAQLEWPAEFISAVQAISGGGGGGAIECGIPKYSQMSADSVLSSGISGVGFMGPERAMGIGNNSWWGANNNGTHWIKIDFDNAIAIKKVKFATYWSYASAQLKSESVVLEGSNDGSNWTELLNESNLTQTTDQLTFVLNNNTTYLYYRFTCTSNAIAFTGLGKVQMFYDEQGGGDTP